MALSQTQLFRILKEHYVLGLTQREVAKLENLSTATISRAIKEGLDKGYVKITLQLPTGSLPYLEEEIMEKFHLSRVHVTPVDVDDNSVIIQDMAVAFADYLDTLIKPGDVVGLSWGRTLASLAPYLREKPLEDVAFVSMHGGVSMDFTSTSVEQVVRAFAQPFGARAYWLPLPTYLSDSRLVDGLRSDNQIEAIFDQIEKANIAIFSVGGLIPSSLLYNSVYFTKDSYKELKQKGYVGDICARFFKGDGSYAEEDFANKSIGITLEELKKKQRKICVVTDPEKAPALQGALHGGYVDELFLDERTAVKLLKLEMKSAKK